jgi:hypothetical protein
MVMETNAPVRLIRMLADACLGSLSSVECASVLQLSQPVCSHPPEDDNESSITIYPKRNKIKPVILAKRE